MGTLRRLLLAPTLLCAAPVQAESVATWRAYVEEASARFGVPIAWIERVMQAESGGRTHDRGQPIRSSAGAIGLMQLMPATWAEMRGRLGLGSDPDRPRDNILAGALYLRLMYDRFGYPGLFGAYNAGPARYAEHVARGRSLPAETVSYLAKVTHDRQPPATWQPGKGAAPVLFAIRKHSDPGTGIKAESGSTSSLFVALAGRE